MTEDAEIRRFWTSEKSKKFDDHLKLRKEMKGSSRDAGDFLETKREDGGLPSSRLIAPLLLGIDDYV